MDTESYYELVNGDGTRQRLDGINSLESAKATAKSVMAITKVKAKLVKVQEIDPDSPARVRGTS